MDECTFKPTISNTSRNLASTKRIDKPWTEGLSGKDQETKSMKSSMSLHDRTQMSIYKDIERKKVAMK